MNVRIIGFVLFAAVSIAALADLVHSRPWEDHAVSVARIDIDDPDAAEPRIGAIVVTVGRHAAAFEFPGCELDRYKNRFFVHVYRERITDGRHPPYVNRDFDAAVAAKRRVVTAAGEHCIVDAAFGEINAVEIVFGQFAAPEGRCCSIVWSRDLLLARP
jgi:hypothetical protein